MSFNFCLFRRNQRLALLELTKNQLISYRKFLLSKCLNEPDIVIFRGNVSFCGQFLLSDK